MADEILENGSSSENEIIEQGLNGKQCAITAQDLKEAKDAMMYSNGPPMVVIDDGPPPPPGMPSMPDAIQKHQKKPRPKPRASVLEYKTVNEIWDRKNYGRKIVESLDKDSDKVDKYEEYVFVERRRYDEANRHYKTYLDIKSKSLADILREILKDVSTVSMRGDKPEIRVQTLFHYLPQLEDRHKSNAKKDNQEMQHLSVLIHYLQQHFASTIGSLPQLLEHGEITFNLLWALFPPNSIVYTICIYSEQPKCLAYDHGEDKMIKDQKYFVLSGRYLDFDGKRFGEVSGGTAIAEFRGARQITALESFPLIYHKEREELESRLIDRGRHFASLKGIHHCAYDGLVHKKVQGKPVKLTVNGRIMVDPQSFREHDPNYQRPQIDGVALDDLPRLRRTELHDMLTESGLGGMIPHEPKGHADSGIKPSEMNNKQLLVCSPTVLGFSLDRRVWAEFAVSCIEGIQWSDLPFQSLVIPEKKKSVLQALVRRHDQDDMDEAFDDFVEGKGKGLIILLHGPPGVGKTLTAEAISEFQRRPLYRVCAGDLGLDSDKLEDRLTAILDLVARWKAVLLLDEADVFLESRQPQHLMHNTLISVFLRQLEYFQGIMILTTNRVTAFDEAIQSRIHLGIKYEPLSRKAKAEVWTNFLKQATSASKIRKVSKISSKQLEELSKKEFNGRQIKNTVRMAYALAVAKDKPLAYEHLMDAIEANQDFDNDFRGSGAAEAMKHYS
ncbi:hypothetical protein P7C71_g5229, partial [Lecanoromycetidae sp. Uapishka_2]